MRGYTALAGAALLASGPALAEVAVVAVDAKQKLVDGVATVVANPPADTVAVIDLAASPPKVLAEIAAPASVVGPPVSVAITPDEGLALVTSATKIDPADAKKTVPDNRLSVIDLKASPPAVIATLETGPGPAGLSITRDGKLALVANRSGGTVSVFSIEGKTVKAVDTVKIGEPPIGVSHVAITPDGKWALASRDGDYKITLLSINGTKVEPAKRDIHAGLRPYGLDISSKGDVAVVANIGIGGGDADTISVIDMKASPPRVVETLTVGQTPEGVKLSPDGTLCAVVVMNGSNKAKTSPFYAANGKVLLYKVDGTKLTKAAEAPIGQWSQGVSFSEDNKTILVSNMVEENVQVFRWDGTALAETGSIKLKGGGAAIRTADRPR
jgi:DNA-binding beta-propeller fold protein YncE